jgi:probable HAF family extracellular repeat protein
MVWKISVALAALALTLDTAPASTQAQRYTITDLGSLYGGYTLDDESHAAGINNAGVVVGSSLTQLGEYHPVPFIYRNGHMSAITNAAGYATAINNAGQVTGYIQRLGTIVNVTQEAFLYDGIVHRLGVLPRHSRDGDSVAWALNNNGMVVGASGGMIRAAAGGAMVYANGVMVSSNYRDAGVAYAVNDSGAIAGLRAAENLEHAFLVDRHGFRDLGTLDGDPAGISVAYAINASGVVVGYASSPALHAFAYSNGVMRDLGVLPGPEGYPSDSLYSMAFAINRAGDIVGESSSVAFLYRNGTMENLNDGIDHDENGWPRIRYATGINDRGQIVGSAAFGDRPGLHAFLMTPVPATPPQD